MSDEPKVEGLFREWLRLKRQGAERSLQDLCADSPELVDKVREHIRQHEKRIRAKRRHQESTHWLSATDSEAVVDKPLIQIDGYAFLREIGRGGQGIIFKAIQISTGRHVAIKILPEARQLSDAERIRFDREAQVLAALEHPQIVSILDRGHTAGGSSYFTMEYIDGQPLDKWLDEYRQDHPPPDIPTNPAELLSFFIKIADAVNVAHLRGIMHRDLKPSNILVDSRGDPHILDFGLARLGLPSGVYSDQHRVVTMTGQFLGTLPWVSPEQAEGLTSKIDTRTDVYSLGVILYEMLTGEFPYEVVGNMRDVLDNILRAQPKPPSRVIEARLAKEAEKRKGWRKKHGNPITQDLEAIVLKALNKKPEDRYQNAGELARDIGNYLSGRPIEALNFSRIPPRRPLVWIVAAAFAAAVIGIFAVTWIRDLLPTREPEQRAPSVPTTRTVHFLDVDLQKVVEQALGIANDPNKQQMLALQELVAPNADITNLTGIENATNLTRLDLFGNQIMDLSPLSGMSNLEELHVGGCGLTNVSAFQGLTKLKRLALEENQIKDISDLSGLASLRFLKLDGNAISDITPLRGMTGLRELGLDQNHLQDTDDHSAISVLSNMKDMTDLWFNRNKISDIRALREMADLTTLNIGDNQISDLEPLRGLTKITHLTAYGNQIKNVEPLENLKELTHLNLYNNVLEDVSALADLTNLEVLNLERNITMTDIRALSRLPHLRELNLTGSQTSDISVLKYMPNVRSLFLAENGISDISALFDLTSLTHLNIRGNEVSNIMPLSNLKQLHQVELADNRINDIYALTTLMNLAYLDLRNNPLAAGVYTAQIPRIVSNNPGIELLYDEQTKNDSID